MQLHALLMLTRMRDKKLVGGRLIALAMALLLLLLCFPNFLIAGCVSDINLDGKVNVLDFAIMLKEMGRDDCFTKPCKSDLNSDGAVNSKDKEILQSEMGRRDCLVENMEMPENDRSILEDVPSEANIQEELPTALQELLEEELQEDLKSLPASDSEPSEEGEKSISQPSRFKDNGDETVTDLETGLMWTRDANLPGESVLFYEALCYIEEMNRGKHPNFGYADWRLPTLEELRSLKDFTQYVGTKKYLLPDGHPFENVQWLNFDTYYQWPTYFWTTKLSWVNSFYCRLMGRNTLACIGFVWAVRGGKID